MRPPTPNLVPGRLPRPTSPSPLVPVPEPHLEPVAKLLERDSDLWVLWGELLVPQGQEIPRERHLGPQLDCHGRHLAAEALHRGWGSSKRPVSVRLGRPRSSPVQVLLYVSAQVLSQ